MKLQVCIYLSNRLATLCINIPCPLIIILEIDEYPCSQEYAYSQNLRSMDWEYVGGGFGGNCGSSLLTVCI